MATQIMTRTKAACSVGTRAKMTLKTSTDTVISLVQVGISEVCFTRGLFPKEAFAPPVALQGLEGLKPNVLKSGDDAFEGAAELTSWLWQSLPDAVANGWLKKLTFGIAADAETKTVLEEYIFGFMRDLDGTITCILPNNKGFVKPTIETARTQVVKLMRALTTIGKTLDEVPEERWLFCKLEYHDGCPEDYEPPHFVPAGDSAVGFFPTKPFRMPLGNVATPYHTVDLECRSVLDTVEVVKGKGPTADNVSRFETTRRETSSDACSGDAGDACGSDSNDTAAQPPCANTAELFTEPQTEHVPATSELGAARPALRQAQYVERWAASAQGRVTLLDAMQRFSDVPAITVQSALGMLVTRGVLRRTADQDTYEVAARPQGAHSGDRGGVEAGVGTLGGAVGRPHKAELQSKIGGVHSAPGSARTQSAAAGESTAHKRARRVAATEAAAGEGEAEGEGEVGASARHDTQGGKRRKVSLVEKAIYQNARAQREAPPPQPVAFARKLRSKAPKGGRTGAMRA